MPLHHELEVVRRAIGWLPTYAQADPVHCSFSICQAVSHVKGGDEFCSVSVEPALSGRTQPDFFCVVIAHPLNSLLGSCPGPTVNALVSCGMLLPLLFVHPIVLKPGALFSSSLVFCYQICFSHQALQQRTVRSHLFQVQVAFTVCFDRSSRFP